MNKFFSTILILLTATVAVNAQQRNVHQCLTDFYTEQAIAAHPEYKIEMDRMNEQLKAMASAHYKTNGTVYIVPIVFHVFHKNGKENISREQILDQIRILNEDYRKTAGTPGGSSTNPIAADCEIEFRLANRDPSGNCFDGINRIYDTNGLGNNADDAVKGLVSSLWRGGKYFNVYVVSNIKDTDSDPNTTTLGYAQFPNTGSTLTRGVVMRSDYVGTIGTSSKTKGGRVLTHEVGHCFGLYHTFQSGCFGGDQVADTPPVADQNFGACTPSKNSCTNDSPDLPDMLENYMDYTDGDCQNIFTTGQKTRMRSMISTYYTTLVSASNLAATGVENYTAPASTNVPPVTQDFETATANNFTLSGGWSIENLTGNAYGWRVTDSAKFNGNKSIYLPSYTHPTSLTRYTYNIYSPSYNLSMMTSAYFNFAVSCAQRITTLSDSLRVFVSTDCGKSWTTIFKEGANVLSNNGVVSSSVFVPASKSQWKTFTLDLASYRTSNVRIRIEFFYYRGNNLYLDDLNISSQMLSSVQQSEWVNGVSLYPNPATQSAKVDFTLLNKQSVKAELVNMMGQHFGTLNLGELAQGEHSFNTDQLHQGTLPEGVYLVKITAGGRQHVLKLIISR